MCFVYQYGKTEYLNYDHRHMLQQLATHLLQIL